MNTEVYFYLNDVNFCGSYLYYSKKFWVVVYVHTYYDSRCDRPVAVNILCTNWGLEWFRTYFHAKCTWYWNWIELKTGAQG